MSREGRAPAAPLVAAALVRLALWALALVRTGTRIIASGDTASYLEPGRSLLFHGRFQTGGLPEIDRTPGYPLFLAATSGAGPAVAALAQVALGVACVWLVARLAWAIFQDVRVALCAAWLFAFEPVAVTYSVRLLSETFFLVFLLLSLERLVVFLRTHELRTLVVGGLALTAAIFVRPIGYFLPFLVSGGFVLVFWREKTLRWRAAAILLVTTLPWLALWQVRNRIESGYGGFSSIAARNLYFYSAVGVLAESEGKTLVAEQRELGYFDDAARSGGVAQLRWQSVAARRILGAHRGIFFRQQLVGSAVVAFTPCATDLLNLLGAEQAPERVVQAGPLRAAGGIVRTRPLATALMAVFALWLLVLYLFAVRGIARNGMPKAAMALLFGVALYFLAASGGVQAVGRYRLPVMPIVCALAAAGFCLPPKSIPRITQ